MYKTLTGMYNVTHSFKYRPECRATSIFPMWFIPYYSIQCANQNDTPFCLNTKPTAGWTISIFRGRNRMPPCQLTSHWTIDRQDTMSRFVSTLVHSRVHFRLRSHAPQKKGKKKPRRFRPMVNLRIVESAVYVAVYVDGQERLLRDNTLWFEPS